VAIDAWPQRRRTLIFPVIYVCFAGAVLIAFFLKGDGDLIENNPFSYFCAFGTLIHFIVYFLVPVFFLSGFFPAMVRCSVKDPGDTGRVVGLLLFVFTVSSGLASLATPFILFEKFGTIGAVYILSALAALGVFLLSPTLVSLGLVLAGSSLIFFVPRNYYYRLKDYHAKRHPYKIIEDHNGVLHLTPLSDDPATADFLVRMNRTPASGTVRQIPPRTLLQYNGSDMVAADKEFRPKDILVIGLGGGEFVYGMLRYDFVASVTIVELFQSVVDAFRDYSGPEILGALKDPRVTLIIDDGRKYVNRLEGTDKKFDVIQIGVCLPVTAGGSSVYTVDFYQKLKNILKPGGCISILEMQHPVEAGLQVFKWGYKFFGDIGQRQFYLTDKMIDDKASYGVDAKIAAMAAIPDGASMTIYRSHNIRKPFWLNTDDRPIQEFYAIREFLLPKLRFIKPLRRFEWTSSVETTKSPAPAVVNIKADRRDDVPAQIVPILRLWVSNNER